MTTEQPRFYWQLDAEQEREVVSLLKDKAAQEGRVQEEEFRIPGMRELRGAQRLQAYRQLDESYWLRLAAIDPETAQREMRRYLDLAWKYG